MKRNILITGASSGFGKLATERLIQQGHNVIAAIRGGEDRFRTLFPAHPSLTPIDLELSDPSSISKAMHAVQTRFGGKLDVLINNAGMALLGPLEMQKREDILRQFQVNVLSPLELTRQLLPALRQSQGRVLNVTSLAGITVFPFYGTYAATKHAFHALSEAMYYEFKPFGVQVAAIEPGGYKTSLMRNFKLAESDETVRSIYAPRLERFQVFLQKVTDRIEKDPEPVVRLLAQLCTTKKLRPRYLVGPEPVINLILRKVTPDRIFVPMQDWIYRTFFF